MVTALQVYAKKLGFVMPTKCSHKQNVLPHCNRSGQYRRSKKKMPDGKHKMGPKKDDYLYLVYGYLNCVKNKWLDKLRYGDHNHILDSLMAHPFFVATP